jgi:hypothetical protein
VFKRIGVGAEVQTQDLTFDAAYFIGTTEPNFAQALLTQGSMREAIVQVMDSGFDCITIDDENILAQVTNPQIDIRRTAHIDNVVEGLYALSLDQQAVAPHLGRDVRAGWKLRIWTTHIVLGVIGAIAAALVFFGSTNFRPFDMMPMFKHSLGYAGFAFVVSVVVLLAYLRGRSSSHIHLLVGGAIALIARPFFSYGALMIANGFNVDSVDAQNRGAIEKKWSRTNKGNKTYKIRVRSWRPGRQYEELVVPRTLYEKTNATTDDLLVTTRSGNFGYEWISAPVNLASVTADTAGRQSGKHLRNHE